MTRGLGIVDEVTFGTPVTPPTTFLDCKSISLHPEREVIQADGMTALGPLLQMPGNYKIVGDVEIPGSADNLIKFLKYLVGDPTSTEEAGSTGNYKHVFNPLDTMKFGTFYKLVDMCAGVQVDVPQYTSVAVTQGKFEVSTGNPLMCTFSHFGVKDAKVSVPTIGTMSTVRPFASLDANVYSDIAGSIEVATIASLSITHSRPIAEDNYVMNSPFMPCFIPGMHAVEGEMDMIFSDWTTYTTFWGSASAPIAKPAPGALLAKFAGDAMPGGAGDFAKYGLQIELPKIIMKVVNDPMEMRNKIIQNVQFVAMRGTCADASVNLAQYRLFNRLATA